MKKLGLDNEFCTDVFKKEMRSVLEFAVPVWSGGISKHESNQIEKVQKTAVKIILQNKYSDYDSACNELKTENLNSRREKLCLKFARNNLNSKNTFFATKLTKLNLRKQRKFQEMKCNTTRMFNSSIQYMSRLLNKLDVKMK